MRKSIRAIAALSMIVVSTTACGALDGHPVPSDATTDTLTPGWERRFTLDWSVEAAPHSRIEGYVVSHYGTAAEPVRVLAQALDASGTVVGQRIAVVPGGVGGFGRAYFEIRELPAADRYRVTVWDYNTIQS